MRIEPITRIVGHMAVPGDKSISHRSVLLAALCDGETRITGFGRSADTEATIAAVRALGITVYEHGEDTLHVFGQGLRGLTSPGRPIDCANAGTLVRLLSGILAGQNGQQFELTGDASLSARPMKRVTEPLGRMGAGVETDDGHLPLGIEGRPLRSITYELPVASAQVKSAILLAGLYATGETTVVEPAPTRDHTEIALEQMGADIGRHHRTIAVRGRARLTGKKLCVPGDISSAAFFIVAGLLAPESNLLIRNVGLNPTRTAILDVLAGMGGRVRVVNVEMLNGELLGDLHIEPGMLRGGEIPPEMVPGLIDELPVLSVFGTQTEEGLAYHGAAELRVKESDRIAVVAENLRRMGAEVEEFPDGLRVAGRQKLRGAEIETRGDHRIAMAFAVAGLVAEGATVIRDSACVDVSFPEFFETLDKATA